MAGITDIVIIFNPVSTGDSQANAEELSEFLKRKLNKVPVKLIATERRAHAEELAYEIAKNCKRPVIISASGDGGYNEVINGAMRAQKEGSNPICVVLPSGNANDHARTLQTDHLEKHIIKGKISKIDLLKVTTRSNSELSERYAHSYVGLGLTPTVAVELNKHTLNSLKEAYIVIKTFWKLRPIRIKVGQKVSAIDSLICSTVPEMAKLLKLSGSADPKDGKFELISFEHDKKIKLIYRLARGTIKPIGAKRKLRKLTFTLLTKAPIQLDGEVTALKQGCKVTIAIEKQCLHTII